MTSTYRVSHYLQGIIFPTSKQQLIERAKNNNAPNDVIDVLSRLPDQDYNTMADLWYGRGQEE